MMKKAEEKGVKLLIPLDNICADDFSNDANVKVVAKDQDIEEGWQWGV